MCQTQGWRGRNPKGKMEVPCDHLTLNKPAQTLPASVSQEHGAKRLGPAVMHSMKGDGRLLSYPGCPLLSPELAHHTPPTHVDQDPCI